MACIAKEVPFGEDEEKSRKTLYHFSDQFMAFYYKFIAPNKSYLALGKPERILQKIHQDFNVHVGELWERSCVRAISLNVLFGVEWGVASRWWGSIPLKDSTGKVYGHSVIELDAVAESLDKSKVLVGECMWNSADYAGRILHKLKIKVSEAKIFAGKEIEYVLFLRELPLDVDSFKDSHVHILFPDDIIPLLL